MVSLSETNELIRSARQAMSMAYCPYSKFPVGCALLCQDGTIITGCNVENSAYPSSICAERTAFVKAISMGQKKFKAVAVVTNLPNEFCAPCGQCRQFMSEFGCDLIVILTKPNGEHQIHSLKELLPHSFGPNDLKTYNESMTNA
ncbi:cytidine deaminase-like protein [Sarcoptes scabiei]|nr:cytidine deaminase-like protein [Sarcoptes scabiei]